MLTLFDLDELGLQHAHTDFAVLVLGPFDLAADHDARGLVDETDRRRGLVDLLAAGAGRAVHFHLDVFRPQVDFDAVVDLGHDFDGREGRVTTSLGVEGGDTDEAMYPGLTLHVSVGVLALDEDGGGLEARFIAVEVVEGLDLEAVALAPAVVHAEQHGGPVLGFGAAGARVEREERVGLVVLTGEQGGEGHGLQFGLDLVGALLALVVEGLVFLFVGELDHDERVFVEAFKFFIFRDLRLQPAGLFQDLLGVLDVVPEPVLRGLRFELRDLFLHGVEAEGFAQLLQRFFVLENGEAQFFVLQHGNTFL